MRLRPGHIAIVLLLVCLVGGCARRGRVIPADTLASIYADMFIADEWLRGHSEYRRQADTTCFYDPIFERYGYTFADYNASVEHYLHDPARFAKIFRRSAAILRNRQGRYVKKIELIALAREFDSHIARYSRRDFDADSLLWRHFDSVKFWTLDSLTRDSIVRERFLRDSLIRDSIIRDSLVRDSIVRDSLQRDSLARAKKTKRKH